MRLKYFIITSFLILVSFQLFASEGKYYMYGKCTLVEGEEIEGFISIGNERLWISHFNAMKLENPYAKLFSNNRDVRFGDLSNSIDLRFGNNRKYTPSTHIFVCRFNDLKQLRPIAADRLEVNIKGDFSIDVSYNFKNNIVVVSSPDGTKRRIKWDNIASINFMPSPEIAPTNYGKLYIGSVKSTQGSYFGIIEGRNHSEKRVTINFLEAHRDMGGAIGLDRTSKYLSLEDVNVLKVEKNTGVQIVEGRNTGLYGIVKPAYKIRINLPTIGNIDVPWSQVESIVESSINELKGGAYNDSTTPKRLIGTVELNNKQSYSGPLAYDLDEALNIEIIDGQNNGISYQFIIGAIKSIEPRNYKYSLITLKNGGRLSIGGSQDIDANNEGVLMLNSVTYIPWREIKVIRFEER